jgi:RNA polymerase sigma factor (sigma-70 family)
MDLKKTIEGCINQDRKCQEELYKQFYPAFFALCKRFFSDKHDILTALNNGMLKLFKNIHKYDASKGDFFNWAYTMVRNAALTLIRDKKTNLTYELNEQEQDKGQYNPFKQLEWKDIYFYLGQLPANTRYVCTLFYIEGFSIKEIAPALNMKEGTVKWHLNECRNRLKIIFEQQKLKNSG